MVKVETLKEDGFVRILRCREDNRIWYQMWLTDLEKNGRRVRGVLGKDRTKDLLRSIL